MFTGRTDPFSPLFPAPRKLMDLSRLAALGWRRGIGLEEGPRDNYRWFRDHRVQARIRARESRVYPCRDGSVAVDRA
jgi:GDP-L-fucose synthase